MATPIQIAKLRRMINDVVVPYKYSDIELGLLIDEASNNLNKVAYIVWTEIAAGYSTLVTVSESGSSRSMGDLYKNALAMAKFYKDLIDSENLPTDSSAPFTVQSERP